MKVFRITPAVKEFPHLTGFLLLGLVLLPPFGLRVVAPKLEIYPSIVLPSRASVATNRDHRYSYERILLIGIDLPTGQLRELDSLAFLDPIPVQNLGELVASDFSLGETDKKRIEFKYLPVRSIVLGWRKSEPLEKLATKDWLKSRLSRLGCAEEKFIIRKTRTIVSADPKENVQTEIIYEKIHLL